VRLKAGFVREAIPATPFTVRIFPETAGDVQEDDLKWAKPNLDSWGTVY
jgi:hypothetical protein